MKHCIFLNGPPRSGKDAAALALCARPGIYHYKFAAPLKRAIAAMLNLTQAELEAMKDFRFHERTTPRQLLIGLSENVVKPQLGRAWFGEQCAAEILNHLPAVAVVSDSGFADEVKACAALLTPAGYKSELWHIHRPGTSFHNDSRSYVYDLAHREIYNDGTLEKFEQTVIGLLP